MKSRILIIFLLSLALVIHPTQASATYALPPLSEIQGYVDNLISSYNALVPSNAPSFDSIKGYFSLYHAIGNTFSVIVMQTDNVSGFATLIFIPIGGNQPNVTIDNSDTFLSVYKLFDLRGEYVTIEHISIDYSNTIVAINLAFGISITDITGDNGTNSKNAAKFLFNQDESNIPNPSSNQPQSQSSIVWILGIVGAAIVFVFGGLLGFFDFLTDPQERRKRVRRFKQLFRSSSNKKRNGSKEKHT